MNLMNIENLKTLPAAAKLVGCSKSAIYLAARLDQLPTVMISGHRMVDIDDAKKWWFTDDMDVLVGRVLEDDTPAPLTQADYEAIGDMIDRMTVTDLEAMMDRMARKKRAEIEEMVDAMLDSEGV